MSNLPAYKTVYMLTIKPLLVFMLCCCYMPVFSQSKDTTYLLKPDRVFDGEQMHEGWQVLIRHNKIEAAGSNIPDTKNAIVIELKGCTLLPGLIEDTVIYSCILTTKQAGMIRY